MEAKLNTEMEKSRILREKQMEQERTQNDVNDDYRDRCIPALQPILAEILTNQEKGGVQTNGFDEDESSEQRVQKVRDLLKSGEFDRVAHYIVQLDACNIEKRATMAVNEQVLYFVVLLNSYLFDDFVSRRIFTFYWKG